MRKDVRKDHSRLDFTLTPEEIRYVCEEEQARLKQRLETIAAVPLAEATFATTVLQMEYAMAEFSSALEPVNFLKYVSPSQEVRDAADECETAIGKLHVDIFARDDLFRVVKAAEAKAIKPQRADAKLLEEYLTQFRVNGLELEPEPRKKFVEKKKRLVELQTQFEKNLVDWSDHLEVTREELDGLPEDYIRGLEKASSGKYKVTLAYPHYFPFMQSAKNGDARRRLEQKFMNKGGGANTELLEEAIRLRHELASMLGKPTHAHFVLERRMAKEPKKVLDFLNRLIARLRPKGEENLKELLELKRKELGDPSVDTIHSWDWRYYENELKKTKYQVDHERIKEYFPLEVVNQGMFEIYETLLGVDFIEDKEAPRWHESVLAFKVLDRATRKEVARFYLDLFPREGKYGHAAAFTLLPGYRKRDGSYQIPVSSVVANFNAPMEGQPSLLLHNQVETHFHEFGHIMHQVLTTAPYATLSGTSVKRDFVEAPSQMLENWVWEKASLAKLSGHYQDPKKPLPDDLLNSLVNARLANVGILYLRQLFFGVFDMTCHTQPSADTTELYRKLMKEIMLIELPDGTQPQASFGHLMGGYDAGYYGYLWSEVFAQDMFTRFEAGGLLNPTIGADYRKWILEPGGTIDPSELIKGFLGREPNETAFLKGLGLDVR